MGEPFILARSGHPISRRDIDPDALKILYRLYRLGFTAYLCGGAVRDLILGRPPKDFDIVTDARPGQIKRCFHNVYIIGRRFRLAHIHFHGGKTIEVATFRRNPEGCEEKAPEVKIDPKNAYGTPCDDAFRRDITINALFYDAATGSVLDYTGGIEDLAHRLVRIIGDPAERFTEDPVRIWRVVRHAARLQFGIEEATERAIPQLRHLLAECSGARLYEELNKDLAYDKTRPVIEALRRYHLLRFVLGQPGEDYETNPDIFSRLCSLLEIEDKAKASGCVPSLVEMYAVVFWPWMEPLFAAARGDMHVILKNALATAGTKATLPRNLRADVIQTMIIAGRLVQALRSGQMRWSLKQRPHYAPASQLLFLIEKGRPQEAGESFESLFRQAFPSAPTSRPRRRRRHRHFRNPQTGPISSS